MCKYLTHREKLYFFLEIIHTIVDNNHVGTAKHLNDWLNAKIYRL